MATEDWMERKRDQNEDTELKKTWEIGNVLAANFAA
jgi:hypothetical protein